jgi:hypothetical protein
MMIMMSLFGQLRLWARSSRLRDYFTSTTNFHITRPSLRVWSFFVFVMVTWLGTPTEYPLEMWTQGDFTENQGLNYCEATFYSLYVMVTWFRTPTE